MKKLFLPVILFLIISSTFSQTVTWSEAVSSKKKEDVLLFAGSSNSPFSGYYIDEIGPKEEHYITGFDQNLKVQNTLMVPANDNYFSKEPICLNNKLYTIYINKDEYPSITVYFEVKKMDGSIVKPMQPIGKIETKKSDWFDKKSDRYLAMNSLICIKPSYDGKSFMTAIVNNSAGEGNVMVNISEWNEDLVSAFSSNYRIPFESYHVYQKDRLGGHELIFSSKVGDPYKSYPRIRDLVKDPNGFIYMFVNSDDPEDHINTLLYQLKVKDAAYIKSFKSEWAKTWSPIQTQLLQDNLGRVYVSDLAYAWSSKSERYEWQNINAAYLARFKNDGTIEEIISDKLSAKMLNNFDSNSDIDKGRGINSLRIKDIYSTTDGGFYLIWQHEPGAAGTGDQTLDILGLPSAYNVLVQYYDNNSKVIWEKVIYKKQENMKFNIDKVKDFYVGINSFVANNNLFILYQDNPDNASKGPNDKDVSPLELLKPSGKTNRTGFMVASFTKGGIYTRKYVNWANEKPGYSLVLRSIKYVGNNEVIGTARILTKEMEKGLEGNYSVFKIKL